MPYIVTNSDGSSVITVPDSAVDTGSYSLALIGRNVANYGQYFAQNTIRQLENFASSVAPSPGTILEGQLWYNKSEQQLSVWQGSSWKRIGTVVGADNQKPTTFRTSGTSFFNTTTNKLEIWNNGWQEAGYGGTITNEYSADTDIQSPTTYGTRLRTLFLKEATTDNMLPVLALVYTKSPQVGQELSSTNSGTTEVPAGSGNKETIMAFWSDFDFYINSSGTDTPVSGSIVNYYDELTETDVGILAARPGRAQGQVFKGLNQRGEYEGSSIATFDTVYITGQLGSDSVPVPIAYFTEANISTSITVQTLTVRNDATVQGALTVTGNITSTSGTMNTTDLVVTNSSILNGSTTINGQLTVNGVNTQSIGTDAERIEDAYFNNVFATTANVDTINVANLNVSGTTTGLNVDGLSSSGNIVLSGGATLEVDTTIEGTIANVRTIDQSTSGGTKYVTFVASALNNTEQPVQTDSGYTYVPNVSNLSVQGNVIAGRDMHADNFVGVASSAKFADLAENYVADQEYVSGTVVMIGGTAEVTACGVDMCQDVFGVISTDPAYLMNSGIEGVPVALQGRVPVQVQGRVAKGERLVASANSGVARGLGADPYDPRSIIGRSLEDKDSSDVGTVEAVIGVK